MPKRKPPKMVTKHYTYPRPHSMTYPSTWWEKKDREKDEIYKWNEDVAEYRDDLELLFLKEHGISVYLELQRFHRINEMVGIEKINPRNYLSFEKLAVQFKGNSYLYYFGNYDNLEQVTEHVTTDILLHKEKHGAASV